MIIYTALQNFKDTDTQIIYHAGDVYPAEVSQIRLAQLLGDKHPNHKGALIKATEIEVPQVEVQAVPEVQEEKTVPAKKVPAKPKKEADTNE